MIVSVVVLLAAAGAAAYRWWPSDKDSAAPLTVRYRTEGPAETDAAKPWLEVINTSGKPVDLADVTVRYHYTADDGAQFAANCVQTSLDCSRITLRTAAAQKAGPKADRYLEIGFTGEAGTLKPGGTTQAIGLQLYRVDHKGLDQSDDYSFDAEKTSYQESERVTAYLDGAQVWGEGPQGETTGSGGGVNAQAPAEAVRPPAGLLFDDFAYTGPEDPSLAANGWVVRSGAGGPGIEDSWSAKGVTFPAGENDDGGQALRLEARTDGTAKGTVQSEFHTARPVFREGTLVARVYFSDEPANGQDGDHVSQSVFAISPDHESEKYSELDFEYMANGGWGRYGPILDTTSWRSSDLGDRVTQPHQLKLGGWHTLAMTAADGKVTYSVDGKVLFTSGKKYLPREPMSVNFSNWFIDLPFKGNRSWVMNVDWVYLSSGRTVSPDDAAKAAADFAAAGTSHVNTLAGSD
ncbi:cellulose binding domain-containing protein [Streptomyces lancefieldiae]|uniref:Cellulose binding domain-containing protein n=1 Tax=Streptomyces lancefieldiae TaxID=3075520 RepID=A0ABU3AJ19_9ACTN|nr:cellulose binding domain-containing protein [Streptomyces sp. DSM 40712]MDT0610178.1 cellulose binding domain-containing protein [Streptomyces sp. DSM 40712]